MQPTARSSPVAADRKRGLPPFDKDVLYLLAFVVLILAIELGVLVEATRA